MADSPTIVVASLSDEELRKSVNNLVKDVNGAVNQMANNFDNTIASMRQTLQSFGNVKFDFGGKASGKSKLASELKEQTDAMNKQEQAAVSLGKVISDTSDKENKAAQTKKNLALTSDQEALALEKVAKAQRDKAASGKADMQVVQNAISGSERLRNMYIAQAAQAAKRFDVSGIQTLRMREHELEAGIKSASDMAKRAKKDVDDLNNSIESYRRTMTSLPNDKNGFAQRQDIQKLINETTVLRDVALDEQKKWETSARQLSAQYENVKSQIRTMGQNLIEAGKAEDSAVESAKRHTEEIKKQAEEIRKSKSWQEKGLAVVGDYVVKDPERFTGSKKEKQTLGTLEEQILNIKRQQTKEIDNQIEKERQLGNEIKKTNSVKPVSYREDLKSYLSSRGVRSFDYLQDSHVEQYKKIDLELEKLKSKYDSLGDSAKKSEEGMRLSSDIDAMIQRRTDFLNKLSMQLKDVKAKSSDPFSSLRNSISQALGVTQESIRLFNTETASISKLQKELKILQSAYQNLSPKKISAGEGDAIAAEIQKVQRAIQLMQNQMSRPTNLKSALGLSENTIDDIAYKMRQLSAYRTGLNVTDPKQIPEMRQTEAEIDRLKRKYDELMGKTQQLIGSNTTLGRSWTYMKNRLAFYVTVGASTSFIKNLIEVRSQYEMNEKALGILLDSASRGTRIFNELSQMALVSPYTLIELSNAAKQLTAYDIAAKDVVDTTRRLADMASAVGVPVERLTYALGQIKAYGYLNSRDARMFANAGIPLVKQLADRYSELEGKMVSTADVYDRMKKKAIDYNDVMAVINKMTDEGGKFFDFQAKMAETLKVRLANLTLAWNNMLNDMGKDNQGVMTTGLKGLTVMFKHWRELYRIISTVIVAIGAYKAASMLAGIAASRAVSSTIPAWFRLANIVRTTQGNIALLGLTMRSIPFTAWVTAIATLASYFILFNNSSDDVKQKLEGIKSAFDGVRKEVETMFADAIKTDNIGTQLTKLRDMLELAETELGVTIPIKLEDVNESNVRQKLKEAKQFIDEYVNFSQTFSEAAAGTKFNELMNDFGSKARSTYTNVTESINSVVVALQELSDKGQASKRDIEILNELTSGQKDDESRIEYLQRLISLYEELGLIGQKKVTPKVSFFGSSEDNIEELEQQQENALDRLGIKNKSVFENMLKDVQGYYSSSSIAAYQFEQQVMRVAEKIDINNIPVEQRTMKLTAAINEEASQNNWNQFEKEFARQIANEKFGTTIEISDESKKAAEEDLQAWQRNIQNWAKNNGITFDVSFQTNDTEASYAKRMLQEAKDAKELWETLGRKEKQGTGSKDATTKAYNDYIERRKLAAAAGADLSSLDAKSRKAASKAESELAKALKDELSTIDKVRSIYKDLTKDGMSHANSVERATRGWDETVNAINKVLQKNGLQKLDLTKFAGVANPREIVNMLQSQLDILVKRGAKPAEIKELRTKIQTLNVDAEKYDLTMITKGLNNELGKLKDEYELAVELDANPELGDMFADMFGINTSTLPKTFGDALDRAQIIINRKLAELKISTPFDLMEGNIDSFAKSTGLDKDGAVIKELVSAQNAYRDMFKKNIIETEKVLDDYIKKYGDYSDKIAEIEASRLEKLKKLNEAYYTEEMRKRPEYVAKLNAIEQGASKEKQQVDFDEFKNSRYYTMMFENLDYISTKTIRDMRDRVRELIDTMNDLTPEQLKTLMSQYEKLEQKLVKRSPFKTLTKDLKEYFSTSKERKSANQEFKNAQKEYDAQKKSVAALKEKYEQAKANSNTSKSYLDFLQIEISGENEILQILKQQLDAAQKKTDKYNLTAKLAKSEALQVAQVVGQNLQSLGELRDFLQQDLGVELSDELNGLVDGLSKVGQGINKITSSATSGDIVGVITGVGQTIYGLYDGIASIFGGGSTSDKKITKQIKESELAVKNLELAYIDLEHAINQAYGMATIGAQKAAIANKELQLAELKRQLSLEESRSGKKRDQGKIDDLKKQVKELEYEIKDAADEIVNDLLGISSVGDAMESLMGNFIDALRNGEDAMQVFGDSIDDMIANMIKKMFVSKVLAPWFEEQWNTIQKQIDARAKDLPDKVAEISNRVSTAKMADENNNNSLVDALRALGFSEEDIHRLNWFDENGRYDNGAGRSERLRKTYREALSKAEKQQEELNKQLTDATTISVGDIRRYAELLRSGQPVMEGSMQEIQSLLEELGLINSSTDENLSALQQGIQGITEETAGALEAYANSISQQVYLQSDLLTQIRDVIVNIDYDIHLDLQAQILLQMQQSYQVQMAIHNLLNNTLNPSGMAFNVNILS